MRYYFLFIMTIFASCVSARPSKSAQQLIENLWKDMITIKGGTFMMGATSEQVEEAYFDENPVHQVTVSSFYLCKYEVTQALWEAVMGECPSLTKSPNRPVSYVSWDDCQMFISKLNELTGKKYRLPTEAEWEYAARGGRKSKGYKYAGSNDIEEVAWLGGIGDDSLHNVGTKLPNELGLYNMAGNVYEWCYDWYAPYSSIVQKDPHGPEEGKERVYRGGGCGGFGESGCRVSSRGHDNVSSQDGGRGLRIAHDY